MSNVYDELYKRPGVEPWQLSLEQERLAKQLILFGRLRIDTDFQCNFTKFSRPEQNLFFIFSYREIFDRKLIGRTKNIIKDYIHRHYREEELESEAEKILAIVRNSSKLNISLDKEIEEKVAYLLVQATHPSVIMLALLENTEIFVSFSHNVGGMLDIPSWREVGSSGGLQRTDGYGSAVFVSCGSNPFFSYDEDEDKQKEKKRGFNDSLSRLLVIAGQELGHYADIIRDNHGYKVSRHSADLGGRRAKRKIKKGRKRDIIRSRAVKEILDGWDIKSIIRLERHIKFFKYHKRKGPVVRNTQINLNRKRHLFFKELKKHNLDFLIEFKKYETPCIKMYKMVKDMLDNLSPDADAYKGDTEEQTEAIACIEALARVPQQEIKWGPKVTQMMMPNLYKVYYGEVIPSCIKTVEIFSGERFIFGDTKMNITKKFFISSLDMIKKMYLEHKKRQAQKKEDKLNQSLGIKIIKSRKYY